MNRRLCSVDLIIFEAELLFKDGDILRVLSVLASFISTSHKLVSS